MRTAGMPDGTYIFKPKIPIWLNFEGLAVEGVGSFCGHFLLFYEQGVYFMLIYVWSFGILFHILVCCTKKNLATLLSRAFLALCRRHAVSRNAESAFENDYKKH
jgi:hypothetical protein